MMTMPGRNVRAKVIDMSRTGVAVSMMVRVPVGTRCFVGTRAARAVREMEDGPNRSHSGTAFEFETSIPDSEFGSRIKL